jgi:hypothetical protein
MENSGRRIRHGRKIEHPDNTWLLMIIAIGPDWQTRVNQMLRERCAL